ncbi:PilZ domain-containing protein [Aliikangiella sp. IMCC44632]
MSQINSDKERREYFRIKNWIILNQLILESENQIGEQQQNLGVNSPRITLLQELSKLENENLSYLNSLNEKESQLGNYLINMDKKMSLITRFIIQSLDTTKNDLTEVDISGGGVRFNAKQACKIDDIMKIELVLLPECVGIAAFGRVVDVKPINDEEFEIALMFTKLKEADRDAIIKHVFQIQSKQLRNKSDSEKNSTESEEQP